MPSEAFDVGSTTEETRLRAKVISGDDIYDTSGETKVTDEVVTVKRLLGPLTPVEVPLLRCIGLNYAKHSMFLLKDFRMPAERHQSRRRVENLLRILYISSSLARLSAATKRM